MKKLILILSIFILICTSPGCTENKTEYQNGSTPAAETQKEATLTIIDSTLEKEEYGGYIVTGTAQSDADVSYAEVDVKFYDAEGAVLQSGMTNIVDLKAGEPWKFKVYGPSEDVKEYKIATSTTP